MEQNEKILQEILKDENLFTIELPLPINDLKKYRIEKDSQLKSLRFFPNEINSGGFFICALSKKS